MSIKDNLLQAYYIAIMLGVNVDFYDIDEEKNVLINTDENNKEAEENDLTYILDCIETTLENLYFNDNEQENEIKKITIQELKNNIKKYFNK